MHAKILASYLCSFVSLVIISLPEKSKGPLSNTDKANKNPRNCKAVISPCGPWAKLLIHKNAQKKLLPLPQLIKAIL